MSREETMIFIIECSTRFGGADYLIFLPTFCLLPIWYATLSVLFLEPCCLNVLRRLARLSFLFQTSKRWSIPEIEFYKTYFLYASLVLHQVTWFSSMWLNVIYLSQINIFSRDCPEILLSYGELSQNCPKISIQVANRSLQLAASQIDLLIPIPLQFLSSQNQKRPLSSVMGWLVAPKDNIHAKSFTLLGKRIFMNAIKLRILS